MRDARARVRSGTPARVRKNTGSDERKTNTRLSSKRKEVFLRSRGESKESPQLFSRISSISFFNPFSFNKIMLIRKKTFIFALDKTQPSLLLAALRCLSKRITSSVLSRSRFPVSVGPRTTAAQPERHLAPCSAFSGLKPAHRFTKCATLVVSFHFHHIVRQVFQKKFVFLPQTEYTHPHPLQAALA